MKINDSGDTVLTGGFLDLCPIGTMSAMRFDSDQVIDPNTWEVVGSGTSISVRATPDCFDNPPSHIP